MSKNLSKKKKVAISRLVLVTVIAAIVVVSGVMGYYAFIFNPPTATITTTSTTTATTTSTQSTTTLPKISLNGAGASFPYPLYSTMIVQYNKIYPNIQINYQSIGSGGGIRQHTNKTVDFGASDAPLTEAQRSAAPNTLHLPMTIGCVVLAYNLPGIPKGLNMTGQVISDIFLGNIKKWNDPAIKNLNPNVQLPDMDILTVHRADGSGTTFVFTSYLSIASSNWKSQVGAGTAVQWPIGLGSAGNEGVAGLVRGTQYTIGYVEIAYALQNKMTYAYVMNKDGYFVEPTLESIKSAVVSASTTLPKGDESWVAVSLLNIQGTNSYPIVSFSYIIVYKELNVLPSMNKNKAQALVDFLWWATHDGQSYATSLSYVPLPQSVVPINEQTISSITYNGQTLRG